MRLLLVLLIPATLLGVTASWGDAEVTTATGVHRGTGVVVALSTTEITLREGEELHKLALETATRIFIVSEDHVRRIGVGDYVAEECVPDARGGSKAVRLTLYRPAWMEIATPEH